MLLLMIILELSFVIGGISVILFGENFYGSYFLCRFGLIIMNVFIFGLNIVCNVLVFKFGFMVIDVFMNL